MKTSELVTALAALDEVTVQSIVKVADLTREANGVIASLEPAKKRRGRKPGVKVAAKAAAKVAPKKVAAKKSSKKSSIPDSFTE